MIFGHGQRGALDEDGLILPVSDSEPQTRSRLSPLVGSALGPLPWPLAEESSPGLAWGPEAGNWRPSGSAIVHEPRARRVPPKPKSAPGLHSGNSQRELQAARFRRGGIVGAQVRDAAARIGAFCHLKAR